MSNIKKISGFKDIKVIKETARVLEKGGLAIIPAKSFYGISADVFNKEAVNKIFKIKKRSYNLPILVLVENSSLVSNFAKEINKTAEKIMKQFWPGNVTLVFNAKKSVPENITGGTKKVGIRIPENSISRAVLKHFGGKAITSTSVNVSGSKPASSIEEIENGILNKIDIVLDAGKLPEGDLSTVIDVSSENRFEILREGTIKKETLLNFLQGTRKR